MSVRASRLVGRIRKPINYFEWLAVTDRNPVEIRVEKSVAVERRTLHRKALRSDWSGCDESFD